MGGEEALPGRGRARARQVGAAIALVVLAASALYGADFLGVRGRLQGSALPPPRPPAAGRVAEGTAARVGEETSVRSYPWWQRVVTLEGVGPLIQPLGIDDGAIQWRMKWACESGRLVVEAPAVPPPAQGRHLIDVWCPGSDVSHVGRPGATSLDILADGQWRLEVEQQIDLPLSEAPLPVMTETAPLVTGSFYNVDQSGRGRVSLYRLADAGYALRLEGLFVTPNADLELRLSPLLTARSTGEFTSTPSALVSRLDVTAGSMNLILPPDLDPTGYRSVVIWCPTLGSAYAAATLVAGS